MKKNNYNWNLNSDKLSNAQIDAHKDFDKVLQEFNDSTPATPERAPLIRRLFYVGGAVAAALIGLLFYFGVNNEVENNTITNFKEYAATMPYVNPPLGEAAAKAFVSKSISANEGGVYEFENGSKLTVPPAAFTYGQGGIVQGDVEIKFREYHDFVDFFLSGIPMEYDSAGTQYNLESAGMVEIIAEQDGKRLNMAPGKSIEVELVSSVILDENGNVPDFNIYYLDTEKRNWVYEGVDRITRTDIPEESATDLLSEEDEIAQSFQEEVAAIQQKQEKKLTAIEKELPLLVQPTKPQQANGTGKVFDFAFGEDKIDYGTKVPGTSEEAMRLADEELRDLRRQYANTMWQVSPKATDFSETAVKQTSWDDMALKFIGGQDYELTLIKGDNQMSFLVNPVLTGSDYENALTQFNKQQEAYRAKVAERTAFLDGEKAKFKEQAEEEKRIANLAYEEKVAEFRAKGMAHRATDEVLKATVVNNFTARSLGVWNCDRPLPPGVLALRGNFKGSNDADYHQNIAYLVDKSRNTVSRFYTRKGARLDVHAGSTNLLWLVTNDNKIAIHPPSNFEDIKKKKKEAKTDRFEHTFVMNLVDQPLNSEEDIRKVLDF